MRQRKRAGARPPTRLSPGAAARQGPVPEDFSGEALPSRSSSRPVRSRRHSGRSEIMPSSPEISQTRYAAPGLHATISSSAPTGASCLARARRRRRAGSASRCSRSPHPRPRRRSRRAAAAGAPTRVRARERPRGAPSRGAHRTPPPAAARDRSATSRTATNSTSSAGSSTSAAAPARESGRHTACGAAVETNSVTFTSASCGVRNALALPPRARTRRRARRARASTRRPPPQHCANSAGAAARGVMSSTADRRSWVGRPVGTGHLSSAVAVVDAMVGLWSAGSAPVVTPREPGDPVARRPLHKAFGSSHLAAREEHFG